MGRGKQFKKDKLYITPTEYANTFGGKKEQVQSKPFSTLQFFCCNISLQPWTTPMCPPEGAIFDAVYVHRQQLLFINILRYLLQWFKKYKVNPVTGNPCSLTDFIYLNFAKNNAGK
jgi:peptidyl-prolyl cis-trans isomerase-like protein 2